MEDEDLHELAAKFDLDIDRFDPESIPDEIVDAMQYIDENTGLLGDYNEGIVRLVEGGRKLQWYARGRYFSQHDRLLNWVQMEHDDLLLGDVGIRTPNPQNNGEKVPYAEIHPTSAWGYDDD